MKILHFADLHLGVENYGRIDPETGLSSRLGDFLSTFDEVVEYALSQDVNLVLFCGDAYRSSNPSQTHQREFARRIARIASAAIPILLLVGNHDLPGGIGNATAVEIFDTLLEAETLIKEWRKQYNQVRPHSSLGYRPPAPQAIQPYDMVSPLT